MLILIALLAAHAAMYAQTGTSAITGTITDATSRALPNAKVQITNEESGARLTTLTNDSGSYRISSLIPGRWRLEVTATGFERAAREELTLSVGQVLPVDLVPR